MKKINLHLKVYRIFSAVFFHLEKDIDKIEVSDDEYDKNNEYDVGLVENLNAINTALNYSYNKYMNDYIKSYCSTNDYDFFFCL